MHEPRVAARGVVLLGVHAYPLQDGVHPGGTIWNTLYLGILSISLDISDLKPAKASWASVA